ncbi:MAG: DUF4325 domain-containing protein [Oscillospiraceae bacterium]|nr:DUF4325 domain-containing protein [Oscillospiraceae bacterium]
MSLSAERAEQLKLYLLEKIAQKQTSIVRKTAETFDVTLATVYRYLDRLEREGIIQKLKRDQYILITKTEHFLLDRSSPIFSSEDAIYGQYVRPYLTPFKTNVRGIWDYLCGEIINNVIDHSQAEHLEITISQDYLNTCVQIADDGVGIFEKIRAYLGLPELEDAVGELFKGKLTTDSARHSGEGIFFSSRLADEFVIFSSGLIFTHKRFENDKLLNELPAKGTVVRMTLSNFSKKEAKDVFAQYADTDSGFSKTQIPLRQYFESSPVSRSQAKRLCSRLDRFREVTLDFTGLDWIGQGFAHQLFVVFQSEHPDIRLLPVGMSEDVAKMVRHVLQP